MCGIIGGIAERNVMPILLEGLRHIENRGYDSSKLNKISYIHAEAYPAGELKHACSSNYAIKSNSQEVKATTNEGRITVPMTFNILLQLLSYHVALIKGTDVVQPRNLAKSVAAE